MDQLLHNGLCRPRTFLLTECNPPNGNVCVCHQILQAGCKRIDLVLTDCLRIKIIPDKVCLEEDIVIDQREIAYARSRERACDF